MVIDRQSFVLTMISKRLGQTRKTAASQYPGGHEALLEDLTSESPGAIRFLSHRIAPMVLRIAGQFGLVHEDAEELHTDALVIFMQKVRDGKYSYEGNDPATYVIEIAKRRAFDYLRRRTRANHMPETIANEEPVDPGFAGSEAVRQLVELMERLDEPCRRLIRIKYLEGWSDKEAIAERLTPYSTVNALKAHRSMCMKKLSMIARALF